MRIFFFACQGRVFNVPILVEIPKRVKFTDIASGFDHTILLAENGDVYSMGMGTYVISLLRSYARIVNKLSEIL